MKISFYRGILTNFKRGHMNVYQLNQDEIALINNYNAYKQDNTLLIVCCFENNVVGVLDDDLNSEMYSDYKELLQYDISKIVDVEMASGYI